MKHKAAIILFLVVLCLGLLFATAYLLNERNCYRRAVLESRALNMQYLGRLNEFVPITGIDNIGNQTILFYIEIQATLPLYQQLGMIASGLSQYCFSSLPIEVKEIRELGDQQIAVINLREFDDLRGTMPGMRPSWRFGYFQGSHGGKNTRVLLTESFLQPYHPLPWIDGAIFLYEEKPIRGFDHIEGLDSIVYRNNL